MAKRKQIIKFLDWAYREKVTEYIEENNQTDNFDDFQRGVLYGMIFTKTMIKNKRDKEHDF